MKWQVKKYGTDLGSIRHGGIVRHDSWEDHFWRDAWLPDAGMCNNPARGREVDGETRMSGRFEYNLENIKHGLAWFHDDGGYSSNDPAEMADALKEIVPANYRAERLRALLLAILEADSAIGMNLDYAARVARELWGAQTGQRTKWSDPLEKREW